MPSNPRIIVVVPTIRPESHASFVKAWTPLFEKHKVTLVTVWDGDKPEVTILETNGALLTHETPFDTLLPDGYRDLFCRRTDACRNLGFVVAASMDPTHVLTMDDDVAPVDGYDWEEVEGHKFFSKKVINDPIQSHLDALDRRVPLGWMNTAHDTDLYLRGVPYGIRNEAPVMLSHGVWMGTPDFDGETQLRLESGTEDCPHCKGTGVMEETTKFLTNRMGCPTCGKTGKLPRQLPHSLPYYAGPIPRGVLFPLCGMNVMVRAEALPYLYFAPMGMDAGVMGTCGACWGEGRKFVSDPSVGLVNYAAEAVCQPCHGTGKVPALHRFADIFMGVFLKRKFDELGWGCVTGYSTVHHTRASDARKNFEQEKLGREWMEKMPNILEWYESLGDGADGQQTRYFRSYADKRTRYETLVKSIMEKK